MNRSAAGLAHAGALMTVSAATAPASAPTADCPNPSADPRIGTVIRVGDGANQIAPALLAHPVETISPASDLGRLNAIHVYERRPRLTPAIALDAFEAAQVLLVQTAQLAAEAMHIAGYSIDEIDERVIWALNALHSASPLPALMPSAQCPVPAPAHCPSPTAHSGSPLPALMPDAQCPVPGHTQTLEPVGHASERSAGGDQGSIAAGGSTPSVAVSVTPGETGTPPASPLPRTPEGA